MKILSIRTDNPEAEVGIFDSAKNTDSQLNYKHWQAHRILSETLLPNIKKLIEDYIEKNSTKNNKYGEVFTNFETIDKMLSLLDKDFWRNPGLYKSVFQ